ncbi:enoyl-CoA hydratase-related protein [Rugamonas apoptosis]|uniref:Enoyl-CoA hydratase/isomerase family protein n=1 Tax=Rugamonas apoptosis TaxID=2758570 RepID=A0A7W2IJV6_9BURK|nr:enoyl-CoA hydratase-related protein [Rugamonas apoptosis]MBA5686671.1 enoyl-CoA hydratase/isomerase family protein [Rugamonas apoptosis]
MTTDYVLSEVSDGIATLTLNQPARLNALTFPLVEALRAALAEVTARPEVRAVILTGAGKAFSSGADLGGMEPDAPDGKSTGERVADWMERATNRLILEMCESPVPIVCALNGAAVGGSVGMVLAADIVVAARSSYLYLSFMPALGLVPDMGASWLLPRRIGGARAMGLTLLGERIGAEQAEQWGLVWRCVEDAALPDVARLIASRLAALPAHAALEARRVFAAADSNSLEQQLAYERDRQREMIDLPAFAEGVRAFAARRPPVFPGR